LRKKLRESFERASRVQQETGERLEKADKEIGALHRLRLFEGPAKEFSAVTKAAQFLNGLKNYVMDNLDLFKGAEEPVNPVARRTYEPGDGRPKPVFAVRSQRLCRQQRSKEYPGDCGKQPIFGNVFGKIERRFLFGGYLSDHTMLKPGALGQANGGYLLLSAKDVLLNAGVWPH